MGQDDETLNKQHHFLHLDRLSRQLKNYSTQFIKTRPGITSHREALRHLTLLTPEPRGETTALYGYRFTLKLEAEIKKGRDEYTKR